MKQNAFIAVILSTLIFSSFSYAKSLEVQDPTTELFHSCELSSPAEAREFIQISGSLKMYLHPDKKIRLSLDAKVAMIDESESEVEEIRFEGLEVTKTTLKSDQVLTMKEWTDVLESEFNGEKPKIGFLFQTPEFQESGEGVATIVVFDENNTMKSVVYLGWFGALCQ
jgi:hypothetical protein